ncbi:hypothetical protein FE783_16955 [Paenibacillus mesophilus]|uniref:hypothetical protein n=1 Tax=Paenibacillus mesophilus TaxID=2582849 RepID=UPI00110DC2A6|nr:hypothetical protein [Paenibacillus mesophilus]TMV48738.1 hypothetical protein FE783_16955 [Paenibacillus mesophilus]
MKKTFRITVAASLLSAMLSLPGMTVIAAAEAGPAAAPAQPAAVYALTEQLQVELKSALNERLTGGNRIGIVLRANNTGDTVKRLADYELLVRTQDGAEYTLQPSAANAKAVQPKTSAELSYLATIDRTDGAEITEVLLKEVDYYVYPKKETLLLSIPIVTRPWNGSEGVAAVDPSASQAWESSFSFPSLQSPINYKPVSVRKEMTDKGTVYVLQLLTSNTGDHRELVPDFSVDGRSESKVFTGSRVEQEPIALEAKEEKYIHYAIPTDTDTILSGLNVLTTETFIGAAGSAPVSYKVGRLHIEMSASPGSGSYPAYTFGDKIELDAKNKWIHPDLQLALVGLPINDNTEEGTKTVTATFLLTNNGDSPIPIPVFQTGLLSTDGYNYDGNRQSAGGTPLLPKESVTVHYSFKLPGTETGQGLVLTIEDAVTTAPYKSTIAAYRLDAVPYETQDSFSVYPFRISVRSTGTNFIFNPQTLEYSYLGNYDLTIEREPGVRVDQMFPVLLFELHDSSGRLVASSTNPLTGTGRLVSGTNKIRFAGTTQSFDYPLTLKIYEAFKTDTGESKRLLTQMEQ